jgi:ABC-type dipeptide/oligopeptide/nickel transport system permease subunit
MATIDPAAPGTLLRRRGSAPRHPSPRIAQMQRTFYFLRKNTLAMIGLGILLFFIFLAIYSFAYPAPSTQLQLYCGTYTGNGGTGQPITGCIRVCTSPPNIVPQCGPTAYQVDQLNPSLVPPTLNLAHFTGGPLPLGALTRDPGNPFFYNIFAGLIKGAPWSLGISASIVGAGAGVGLLLGALAGFKGGIWDEFIMRITDIFLSIPGLLLVIVLLSVLNNSIKVQIGPTNYGSIVVLLVAFIVTWWPIYTRIVRGQVLVTRSTSRPRARAGRNPAEFC